MKTLSRDSIQRMAGGVSSNTSISGGGGGGGSAGISTGWVEANFLSKEFFNLLFEVHISTRVLVKDGEEVISDTKTAGVLTPNDIIPETSTETDPETGYVTTTTVILTSIEAKSNFWSSLAISALGQGSGGGGGSVLFEPLLSINASGLAAPGAAQNGMTVVWNNTTHKWEYGSAGGGTDMQIVWAALAANTSEQINSSHLSTALSGYATQTWVNQQGFLTSSALNGYATQTWVDQQGFLTSSALNGYATQTWVDQQGFLTSVAFGDLTSHPTTLSGYGITDALGSGTTFWGQTASAGVVRGNMTNVGSIEMSSLLYMANGMSIQFKDSGGTYRNVMTLNSSNQLAIGYHIRQQGYVTELQGGNIAFTVGTSGISAMDISSVGRAWVKQGTQGLRIGDGLITWDSSNNALKVSDAWGNSASLYALGAVSALGFSSSGGSTSIDSLTINSSILVKDYADTSLKAISVTKATSSTTVNYLNIGETWNALYHDTRIYGFNVQLVSGNGAYIMSMNGAGKVTCPNYLQASRIYLDSSHYLYISGSSLIFSDGSTSRTVATL